MKQLIIGIDMDGVVSYGAFLKKEYIKKHFDIDCKNPSKFEAPITREQYKKMIADLYDTDEYLKAPMIPKAKYYIDKLKDQGHRIVIVTRRTDNQMQFALKWLKNHNIYYDDIVNTSDQPKTEACKQVKPHIFIDDYESAKQELKGVVPHIIIFDSKHPCHWDIVYKKIMEIK